MLFLRTVTGLGIGGSVVSYTLFAEYCPTSSRGWALVMEQGFFSFGALFSVLLAWVTLTNIDKEVAWRWYIGFSALPSWFLVLCYHLIPESVRYYAANGHIEETKQLLNKISLDNQKSLPEGELFINCSKVKSKANFCDLFVPAYRWTSIIMLINFFCTTFCYYGICFISERLFQAGDLYLSMFCTSISELPAIFLAVMFIDRTGRKRMMNICWLVFGVLCLVIMLLIASHPSDSNRKTVEVILIFFARCCVTMLFVVVHVYFAEYYPTVIRSLALGFGSFLGRIAGMITTVVSEDLSLTHALFIYTVLGYFALVLTLMLPQDTTGLKMRDFVDRSEVEMTRYSRNSENGSEEQMGEDVEELHLGMKGKLQQLKAYTFSLLTKS